MTKVTKCTLGNSGARPIWPLVGKRISAARLQTGYTVGRVVDELGISTAAYVRYELGEAPVPAPLLAQLAELLGVSMLWFFQDTSFRGIDDGQADCASSPPSYRVATLEERVGFLTDTFGKLDLEGQQQLLAVAVSLSRTKRRRRTE
jgi:transcriptional regulator with XRE-family HTH domain